MLLKNHSTLSDHNVVSRQFQSGAKIARMGDFSLQQANYAFLPVDSELSQTSSIRTFKIPVEKWNSPAEKHTIGFSEQVASTSSCSSSLYCLIPGAL